MGKIKDMKEYIGTGELLNDRRVWKAFLAEFLGTMFLVFIGCGSCIGSWSEGYAPSVVQISLAFGVTVASIAQAVGHVSGCHINPAVTCAMLVARHVSVVRALIYIVCQCLGAIVGAAILKGVTPSDIQGSLGMTLRNEKIDTAQALGIELLITFVLVITVFGACDERRNDVKGSAPLAIGLSITTCHLFAVPITGSSMNPARSFGPAVISGLWQDHWVYWAGPILGGLAAALIYSYVFRAPKDTAAFDVEMDNYNKRTNNA
ncbi:aquaporin AQPAe.a-like [Penaeus chinensis]|uniref:aquaporin AQPAe.a-like n=1 Tax=Penaeus chinensis TaxID=139456 RepID=UPI001FB722DB|nr:aquaporin AQPAe.a-like [Penaeus chinensis]